jgi:ATP-dependent RNA circularization protein (DNA/RNA ligase family)
MYIKYPRTFHLPWSEGATDDDKRLKKIDHFSGKEVIVTEKLDGENCTMYHDHLHARSIDSKDHPSRHWVKMLHATISHDIPQNWRLCGENMYAKHSIYYEQLTSYYYLFSIWNEQNQCLSWDETIEWAQLFQTPTAPVLYRGLFDEKKIKSLFSKRSVFGGEQEGYVVRLADSFHYDNFKHSVGKFVRKNHVQTDQHWLNQSIIPNGIMD